MPARAGARAGGTSAGANRRARAAGRKGRGSTLPAAVTERLKSSSRDTPEPTIRSSATSSASRKSWESTYRTSDCGGVTIPASSCGWRTVPPVVPVDASERIVPTDSQGDADGYSGSIRSSAVPGETFGERASSPHGAGPPPADETGRYPVVGWLVDSAVRMRRLVVAGVIAVLALGFVQLQRRDARRLPRVRASSGPGADRGPRAVRRGGRGAHHDAVGAGPAQRHPVAEDDRVAVHAGPLRDRPDVRGGHRPLPGPPDGGRADDAGRGAAERRHAAGDGAADGLDEPRRDGGHALRGRLA